MAPDIVQLLVRAASQSPSADNNQPLAFHWQQAQERLSLTFDPERCNSRTYFDVDSHAPLLTLGAAIENVVQVARTAGLELENQASPRNADGQISAVFHIDTSVCPSANCNQHPVFQRHTNRLPYQKRSISDSCLRQIEAMGAEKPSGPEVRVFLNGTQSAPLIELVKRASELRFQIRETTEWLAHSLRFTPAQVSRGDGLDIATLGLPPGGPALLKLLTQWKYMSRLNRFGLYRPLAQIEARPLKQAPALLVIAGQERTPEACVAAGRLLERVWIALNAEGLAVQPFYVITDQLQRLDQGKMPSSLIHPAQTLAQDVSDTLEGRFPYMLLRIGYPAKEPVRSRRYPLEQLLQT